MLDFSLTEEHRILQQSVRKFSSGFQPRIRDLDRMQKHDPEIIREMAALGLLGICIPRRYGGAGMDYVSFGIACEECEYVDSSLRVVLAVHVGLNCLTLLTWGNDEQKQSYLTPQANGEKIGGFAMTEPGAGSDPVGIRTTARRVNGDYHLNGEKTWISLAEVADHFLVFAWTDSSKQAQRDHTGLSCFIVEREMAGLKTSTIHGKLGVRAGNTGSLSFNDVSVPVANRLGEEGEGLRIALFALDQGRYTLASGGAGLVRACLDASVRYARDRTTFQEPIARHQLVKEMIADMALNYEIAQMMWWRVGWMKNRGLRHTREVSQAKWFATEAALKAANDAIQIHGAYGYSDEFPVERYWRNARGAVIYEGTTQIHKLMQADYALGYREDHAARNTLPSYPFEDDA